MRSWKSSDIFFLHWRDSLKELLQICCDESLLFHHIPNLLAWIWWMVRPFDDGELLVMFHKAFWYDLSFVTWCGIRQKVVHCGLKLKDMVCNNSQSSRLWCLNHAQLVPRDLKCAEKISSTAHYATISLNRLYKAGWSCAFMFMFHTKFWFCH